MTGPYILYIIILVSDLNVMVGLYDTLLGHGMENHGLGNRNRNGEKLMEFCNFLRCVIGGIMLENKVCHKASWVAIDQ